ncbi:hypothetical protein AAG570_009617 [Ranatra chinensis]|uniref:Uncharacterized protein n=1 Tax=Ranatra chinensis TaxID=642074 RepID=A0ABD0Z0E6_9HEMI
MASKRRNMFYKNKKQETTEIVPCCLSCTERITSREGQRWRSDGPGQTPASGPRDGRRETDVQLDYNTYQSSFFMIGFLVTVSYLVTISSRFKGANFAPHVEA